MSEKVKKKSVVLREVLRVAELTLLATQTPDQTIFQKKKEFLLMNSVIQQFGKVEKREIT
jgi:ubiquinone/menaquinone biosynthesis C-methylase UbiE